MTDGDDGVEPVLKKAAKKQRKKQRKQLKDVLMFLMGLFLLWMGYSVITAVGEAERQSDEIMDSLPPDWRLW